MAMHFLIRITQGTQRYLSLVERGKSHLDRLCLTTCFLTDPKATFITTLLRCSIWWLLSKSVHILSTYDDLRSLDTAYILCNEKLSSRVGSVLSHVSHEP